MRPFPADSTETVGILDFDRLDVRVEVLVRLVPFRLLQFAGHEHDVVDHVVQRVRERPVGHHRLLDHPLRRESGTCGRPAEKISKTNLMAWSDEPTRWTGHDKRGPQLNEGSFFWGGEDFR